MLHVTYDLGKDYDSEHTLYLSVIALHMRSGDTWDLETRRIMRHMGLCYMWYGIRRQLGRGVPWYYDIHVIRRRMRLRDTWD